MQKRALIIIVAILVVGGGAYAIFHKSSPSTTSSTNPYSSTPAASSSTPKPAAAGAIIETKTSASAGSYLANASGNALYTYGGDTTGVSNCSGSCISAWPIYTVLSSTNLPANVTTVTRTDGTKQYAYKGLPLYTFTGDSSGQVTGDGVSNFHIAKP